MINFPEISSNIISYPFEIKWYGIMYLLAFLQFYLLGLYLLKNNKKDTEIKDEKELSDLLFYGILGVVIGGRLGEVFFYHPIDHLSNPLKILAFREGGMSYHGGLIGVLISIFYWIHKNNKDFWKTTDFIVPLIPLGYAFGRLGNFINQELLGTPTTMIWGILYEGQTQPLHPVTIYHSIEGFLTFLILNFLRKRKLTSGILTAFYLIVSSVFRIINEFFRQPDYTVFLGKIAISSGQLLSIPIMLIGCFILLYILLKKSAKKGDF